MAGLGVSLIAQQSSEAFGIVIEKVSRHREVLGIFKGHLADTRAIELNDLRIWVRQQYG